MEDGSEPDPERMERWRRAVEWYMREFKNGAAYVKVMRLEDFPLYRRRRKSVTQNLSGVLMALRFDD